MTTKQNNKRKKTPVSSEKITRKDQQKIDSLKSIIEEAEKSLFSARAMLSRIEGQNKPSVKKKTYGASPDGKIIEGVFDGQIMIGNDGKQYPVPANYASKSKLVEGDMLKLTITDDGNFIYKQIGPVERKRLIGMVREDESGNFVIEAEDKKYKVLLASVTYYRAQVGDEVTIVAPKETDAIWCSIENVTKKASGLAASGPDQVQVDEQEKQDPFLEKAQKTPPKALSADDKAVVDEWTPKLSELEKEAAGTEASAKTQASTPAKQTPEIAAPPTKDPAKANQEEKVTIKIKESQDVVKKDFPDTPEEFFSK
ncbi:MAG: hypothetical protein ABIC19_01470 [Patescibacteria group bacterium]|nr:hypothetical protein [Patescibacteria group bacterium]